MCRRHIKPFSQKTEYGCLKYLLGYSLGTGFLLEGVPMFMGSFIILFGSCKGELIKTTAQQSVQWTAGTLRVFRRFSELRLESVFRHFLPSRR